MILTKIRIKNLYAFGDCTIDMTYKRQVKHETIPFEVIEGAEKFRVKRVCIIFGANATGKTALGRVLCAFHNLMHTKTLSENLRKAIADRSREAELDVEFATTENLRLHRYRIRFAALTPDVTMECASVKIRRSDSARKARERLETKVLKAVSQKDMSVAGEHGWNCLLPDEAGTVRISRKFYPWIDCRVLSPVLKASDPSIKAVTDMYIGKTSDEENGGQERKSGFLVEFDNGDTLLVDLNGQPTHAGRFSRGSIDAMKVAGLLGMMRKAASQQVTYFVDGQLACLHPYLETNMVNVLVSSLGRNSQLFYTTYNEDILEMDFPVHSYLFLAREEGQTVAIYPGERFKKNDRSLRNAVASDLFQTLPDISPMDDLL